MSHCSHHKTATALDGDGDEQVDWTEDAAHNRIAYAYDGRGRRSTTTDAMNQKTYTDFSDDGKVLATWGATYPVAYEYDLPAPQSSATRQAGAWGRMTAMSTTRDPAYANQNLWNLLDYEMLLSDTNSPGYPAALDTTLWHYDLPTGLLTGKTYSDGKGPSYTYTPDGQLASRTWARGVTTSYAYTNGASLASIAYSDDTSDVTFTYDRLGRQKVAQTFLSAHRYAYDPITLALVSETIIDLQTATTNVLTRTTDTLGRKAGFGLGTDYVVQYDYDAYGRFIAVSSSVHSVSSVVQYFYLDGSGLIASMTNSSGFFWFRTYEQHRDLIASVENCFEANSISRFDYANDSLARRTRRVDNAVTTNDFGYNLRSEVTGALMGTNSYTYAYDPIGNRLASTNNGSGWVYQSNQLNQYTNIADGAILEPRYDLDGNMTYGVRTVTHPFPGPGQDASDSKNQGWRVFLKNSLDEWGKNNNAVFKFMGKQGQGAGDIPHDGYPGDKAFGIRDKIKDGKIICEDADIYILLIGMNDALAISRKVGEKGWETTHVPPSTKPIDEIVAAINADEPLLFLQGTLPLVTDRIKKPYVAANVNEVIKKHLNPHIRQTGAVIFELEGLYGDASLTDDGYHFSDVGNRKVAGILNVKIIAKLGSKK